MRTFILTLPLTLFSSLLFGQNENPYSEFGYEAPIIQEDSKPIVQNLTDRFYLINKDSTSVVGMLAVDPKKREITIFDKKGLILQVDTLNTYSVARWLSADPYDQFNSPYLGMGNNPVTGMDPDGGFNWGYTFVGAATGFGVGSLIGLAVDSDNWWKYGIAGAAIGGIAGASAGDISNTGRPWKSGFEKFRAEIKFSIQGEKYGVWNTIKSGRETVYFGAGERGFTSVKNIAWNGGFVNGVARTAISKGLNPRSSHTVDVELGGTARVIIKNTAGRSANPNEINPKSTPDAGRDGGVLDPTQTYSSKLPPNSTGVKVTLAHPLTTDGFEHMEMSFYTLAHRAKILDRIKIRVRSVHTKFKGGKLFR